VRLPPNSVLNKTIKSDWFARKKWAKMHAALKMCVELDKFGELADNLTVLSKEEWIVSHYNIKEDEDENLRSKTKVGTTKHKREYAVVCAVELKSDNRLLTSADEGQDIFLYAINIRDNQFDSSVFYEKMIDDNVKVGVYS
jgi:hypothetical protein